MDGMGWDGRLGGYQWMMIATAYLSVCLVSGAGERREGLIDDASTLGGVWLGMGEILGVGVLGEHVGDMAVGLYREAFVGLYGSVWKNQN